MHLWMKAQLYGALAFVLVAGIYHMPACVCVLSAVTLIHRLSRGSTPQRLLIAKSTPRSKSLLAIDELGTWLGYTSAC